MRYYLKRRLLVLQDAQETVDISAESCIILPVQRIQESSTRDSCRKSNRTNEEYFGAWVED